MKRVYEFDSKKKGDVNKILEADPYSDDSFARVGYKVKEGSVLGEDKAKNYLYISASDDFFKKADEKLKGLVEHCKPEIEKRIVDKITAEEEAAESGFGNLFG